MQKRSKMNLFSVFHYIFKLLSLFGVLTLICEVGIYYIVLIQCYWPQMDHEPHVKPLKVMLLADTHLLGPKNGHWFDKLRREWQMYRAFQTTMFLHNPEVVFFLGDIFDEGLWTNEKEFTAYVKRFHSLFYVPEKTKSHIVVGNHDIGFHYWIRKNLIDRFENAFNTSSAELINIRGNLFVTLNSMAMEGDGCEFCKDAEEKLKKISLILKCSKDSSLDICETYKSRIPPNYSKPILLQHFPLYRPSDETCIEPDSAPPEVIGEAFREKWHCLSQTATEKLLNLLEPRLAFSGHTHHGCYKVHKSDIPEWTIASFSWRNKQDPTFILASITPQKFALYKCYMPRETTVYFLYSIGGLFIFFWLFYTRSKFRYRSLKDNR